MRFGEKPGTEETTDMAEMTSGRTTRRLAWGIIIIVLLGWLSMLPLAVSYAKAIVRYRARMAAIPADVWLAIGDAAAQARQAPVEELPLMPDWQWEAVRYADTQLREGQRPVVAARSDMRWGGVALTALSLIALSAYCYRVRRQVARAAGTGLGYAAIAGMALLLLWSLTDRFAHAVDLPPEPRPGVGALGMDRFPLSRGRQGDPRSRRVGPTGRPTVSARTSSGATQGLLAWLLATPIVVVPLTFFVLRARESADEVGTLPG